MNYQVQFPKRPWPTSKFSQRLLETFLVLTGRWSLHRAWQHGLDEGSRKEYERIMINGGDLQPVIDAAVHVCIEDYTSGAASLSFEKLRIAAWQRYRKTRSYVHTPFVRMPLHTRSLQ